MYLKKKKWIAAVKETSKLYQIQRTGKKDFENEDNVICMIKILIRRKCYYNKNIRDSITKIQKVSALRGLWDLRSKISNALNSWLISLL